MNNKEFFALVVRENQDHSFSRKIEKKKIASLPEGDILINVKFSALNYKDALSAKGHKGITRNYPHTPGVDAAGIIIESNAENFKPGDEVLVTGYDLGMNTSGGFAEFIRVPKDWVVKIPDVINLRESMIYGTAGFTAGLCIYELLYHEIMPDSGKVLVNGATGGVGTLAIAMLSKLGYYVVAATGKTEEKEFLEKIGAKEIIDRSEIYDISGKPLLTKKWVSAIDNVGGNTLSTVIRSTNSHGLVCSVGLVESEKFSMTVYPFILRGVKLIGIDSAETDLNKRKLIWDKISTEWKIDNYDLFTKEINLEDINREIDLILEGKQKGKVIIKI